MTQNAHYLFIDLETFSGVDLAKAGAAAYAASADFRITLTGWAIDDGDVTVAEGLPDEVKTYITDKSYIKVAHNASFEMACLRAVGCEIDPADWLDTLHMAARLGLPKSLKDLTTVLGLAETGEGKREGARLIAMFAKPGPRATSPAEAPSEWQSYKTYNRYDVIAERAVARRLSQYTTPDGERQIEILDALINAAGCRVDLALTDGAIRMAEAIQAQADARLKEITGLKNPNSRAQLLGWLSERCIESKGLTKADYPSLLAQADALADSDAREALSLRQDTAKAAVKKYDAIARCAVGGRIYGMTQYYGAGTGRWAGRLVQLQNLKKNSIPDLAKARALVKAGDLDGLMKAYPDTAPLEALAQLIRTALIPSEGRKFIVADFSAIEARVIAWLAGEKWRLDVFAKDGDIYKSSYSQAFHVPVENVDKSMRQKGKIMELALGYGGGVSALKAFGADKLGLTEDAMQSLVNAWRRASPRIVAIWREFERLARLAVTEGYVGRARITGGYELKFSRRASATGKGSDLIITLPSGRDLCYVHARVDSETGALSYMAYKNGKSNAVDTYGGKLTENITQAVARDCLAISMYRIFSRQGGENGYRAQIVAHIHDEVIVDAPSDMPVSLIESIMGEEIYQGLHLTAKGYEGQFYYKD